MYNREPVGKYFLQLCTTTPCQLGGCGSDKILNAIEDRLGVHFGQSTKDGNFTLLEVECLGACSNAPSKFSWLLLARRCGIEGFCADCRVIVMQINDDFYEDLTPESTVKILDALEKGQRPKPGPQAGRKTSENAAGLTACVLVPAPEGRLRR